MREPVIFILIVSMTTLLISCAYKQNSKVNNSETSVKHSTSICFKSSSTQLCWAVPDNSSNSEEELKKVLNNLNIVYEDLTSQEWNSQESTIGGIRDYKLSKIASGGTKWNCLLLSLNSQLGEQISIELSNTFKTTVISFLEFQQMSWGYCLFQDGKLINQFCNDPTGINADAKSCKGDLKSLTKIFHVDEKLIKPYLEQQNTNSKKAFPTDEFELDDHWVRVDFMKKLGIIYPDEGKWIYIYESRIND